MISFEHISAGYPGREVLHDVSFTAPKGRVTALVGPNGCGKTTLLLISCGLLRPGSGRVLLEGRPISSYSRRELARLISLLPQTREVPSVTVERLTAYGRYPHLGPGKVLSIQDRRLVEEALRQSGAYGLRHRELRELSGGERQRAYISMALCQDSGALLLDEPTTYLDIGQKNQVMELIRELNSRGKTILTVLHDLPLAFGYSDYVAVMAEGKLQAFGTPGEVREAAAKAFGVKQSVVAIDGREQIIFY